MKMTVETKVRKQGLSKITTIPKTFVDIFSIKEGEKLEWEYDTDEDKQITLRLKKKL